MKVLNLRCTDDHRFEGWFASEDDYQSQKERGLMVCPVCGDQTVDRLPSAPRLNVTRSKPPAHEQEARSGESGGRALVPGSSSGAPLPEGKLPLPSRELTMQSMWLQAVRHVMANTDDVGDRFAEEARRMHYGEIDERAIRGQATPDEAEALRDEGIEVVSMPLPAALKGPLQ